LASGWAFWTEAHWTWQSALEKKAKLTVSGCAGSTTGVEVCTCGGGDALPPTS